MDSYATEIPWLILRITKPFLASRQGIDEAAESFQPKGDRLTVPPGETLMGFLRGFHNGLVRQTTADHLRHLGIVLRQAIQSDTGENSALQEDDVVLLIKSDFAQIGPENGSVLLRGTECTRPHRAGFSRQDSENHRSAVDIRHPSRYGFHIDAVAINREFHGKPVSHDEDKNQRAEENQDQRDAEENESCLNALQSTGDAEQWNEDGGTYRHGNGGGLYHIAKKEPVVQ